MQAWLILHFGYQRAETEQTLSHFEYSLLRVQDGFSQVILD